MNLKDMRAIEWVDRKTIKAVTNNKEEERALYTSAFNANNARNRDIYRNHIRVSLLDMEYANITPEADIYVDYEHQYITRLALEEQLREAGISIGAYGDGVGLLIGIRARVCMAIHELQDRIGIILKQREDNYLVQVADIKVWCHKLELRRAI